MPKIYFMIKRILLVVLFLIIGIVGYYVYMFTRGGGKGNSGPKQAPLALKKHSPAFNKSVENTMASYFDMKAAFVEADTALAKTACKKFLSLIDSIPLDELKKDTSSIYETARMNIADVKANALSLLLQTDITEMRQDFRAVSEVLYPSFFTSINYEGPNMYWQNCPMAFGEGKEANWISNGVEIVNPYLGKRDPTYGAGMLHCGEVKDTIKLK